MNRQHITRRDLAAAIIGAGALCGGALCLGLAPSGTPSGAPGRYSIEGVAPDQQGAPRAYLLDTSTGRVWLCWGVDLRPVGYDEAFDTPAIRAESAPSPDALPTLLKWRPAGR